MADRNVCPTWADDCLQSHPADDLFSGLAVFLVFWNLEPDRRRLDAQRPQQFQIAIDHVGRLGINPHVVQPLAQLAAARVAETDPPLVPESRARKADFVRL